MLAKSLESAEAAIAKGDREGALLALIDAWRACRAPEIEAVIDIVSADADRAIAPLAPESDDYDASWADLDRRRRVVDVVRLLGGLVAGPKSSIPLRVRSLLARGPDPRVGRALVQMIETPPMTSSSAFSTWTKVFGALPDVADTRVCNALEARATKHDGKSQFWPKLTGWIEAVIPQLPRPAALPGELGDPLDRLSKQAARLARGPIPTLAAVAPSRGGLDPATALDAAGEHLEADRLDEALEALRTHWGAYRVASVANLIDELGAVVDAGKPALDRGKAKARHARWMELGTDPMAADVGRLLDSLRDGKLSDVEERLAAMTRWRPDPRVPAAMVMFTEDSGIGGRPLLWRAVYELFLLHADPRVETAFRGRCEHLEGRTILERNTVENSALRRVRDRVFVAFAAVNELDRGDVKVVAGLARRVAALSRAVTEESSDDAETTSMFIEAIVANPDDDGPRLVFADWLLERGDPLGEFITLSIALARGKKVKGKLAKLARSQESRLRGPLDDILYRCEYRGGFIDTAWLDPEGGALGQSKPKVEAMLSDWRWGTIRELRAWGTEGMGEILARAPLRSLTRLRDVTLADLARITRPMPLGWVAVDDGDDVSWAALDRATPMFPSLATLQLRITPPPVELLRSALAQQVETLVGGAPGDAGIPRLDEWIINLYESGAKIGRVEVAPRALRAVITTRPRRKKLQLALSFEHPWYGDDEREELLAMLRRIPTKLIHSTTMTTSFPKRDKRTRPIEEAIAHLSPERTRYKPRTDIKTR